MPDVLVIQLSQNVKKLLPELNLVYRDLHTVDVPLPPPPPLPPPSPSPFLLSSS